MAQGDSAGSASVGRQCAVLRERYRSCLPRAGAAASCQVAHASAEEGVALVDVSLPFCDAELSFCAHFDGGSRVPDIAWRPEALPADFFPRVDFPTLLGAGGADAPSEEALLRVSGGFAALVRDFHEARLPGNSALGAAWRRLALHPSCGRREAVVEVHDGAVVGAALAVELPLQCAAAHCLPEPGELAAALLVRVGGPTPLSGAALGRASVQALLSPALRALLAAAGRELRLPRLCADGEPDPGRLLEVALFARDSLQAAVDAAGASAEARRAAVAALVARLPGAVVEFDAEHFRTAAFLLERRDFYFLLRLRLPDVFPHARDGPELRLRSVYHAQGADREAVERTFRAEVPHSPRWEPREFADRWLRFVLDVLPQFQRDSVNNHSV